MRLHATGADGSTDKYDVVARFVTEHDLRTVLDVGCRDGVLHRRLVLGSREPLPSYLGVDLAPEAKGLPVVVADLARGLPFDDASVELVAALDVVEHLDDFLAGLEELERVTSRYVVLTLPNLAHFLFRARFLVTGRIGGKYDLVYGQGRDRHRWLTVQPQTDAYLSEYCSRRGHRLHSVDLPHAGRKSGPVERTLARLGLPRSWYVWVTVYVIEKLPEGSTGAT